jgi:hypothetical protein
VKSAEIIEMFRVSLQYVVMRESFYTVGIDGRRYRQNCDLESHKY